MNSLLVISKEDNMEWHNSDRSSGIYVTQYPSCQVAYHEKANKNV